MKIYEVPGIQNSSTVTVLFGIVLLCFIWGGLFFWSASNPFYDLTQRTADYHMIAGAMSVVVVLFIILLLRNIARRKQVEDKLQKIVKGTNVGTWEWNVKTGETVFNERWADILGYTLAELQPVSIETWFRLAHPEDLQETNRLLQEHFQGQSEYYRCDARMKHKSGNWIWVYDCGQVSERDTNGAPVKMLGFHIDITARKQAEEALQESEVKYRQLFELESEALFLIDNQTGQILDANLAAVSLYGYSRGELLHMCNTDLSAEPEETRKMNTKAMSCADTDKGIEIPLRFHRKKDGTVFPVEIKVALLMWKGCPSQIASIRDSTKRLQAAKALHRNAEIQIVLREIAELTVKDIAIDALYVKVHELVGRVLPSENFYIALMDEAAGQIIRPYCADELFFTPQQRPIGKGLTEYVMQLGHALHADAAELARLRGNGEVSPIESSGHEYLGAPLKDSFGKSFGVIAVNSAEPFQQKDVEIITIIAAQISFAITRKQAETRLYESYAKLEQHVEERTFELRSANQKLIEKNLEMAKAQEKLRRNALIQNILREIAEASASKSSLEELYAVIHHQIGRVLPAENFYITLLENNDTELFAPYFIDETTAMAPRRPAGGGMADYVMRQRKAAYITPSELARLRESGEVLTRMTNYSEWLGAPLIDSQGKAFGAIALFLLDEAEMLLHPEDVEILTIIAVQVSMAIERKRSEEAARKVQEKLNKEQELTRAFFESIPGMIYLYDDQGNLVRWNKQHEVMTGYSAEEMSSMKMFDWFKGDEAAISRITKGIEDAFVTGYAETEADLQIKDGSTRPMLLTAVPLSFVKKLYFGGVGIDISGRKQAEKALQETAERYRTLVEQAQDGIVLVSPEGRLLTANDAFLDMIGYTLVELEQLCIDDLVAPMERAIIPEYFQQVLSGTRMLKEWSSLRKDGSIFPGEVSAKSLSDGRIIALVRDISERVEREKEIRSDTQLATRVQKALLSLPAPSEYLKIDTVFQPYGYVGGDLYFMDWRYDGTLLRGFLIDATGHGLSTALHTASLHVLLREVNERDLPLPEAMRWLNRRACDYLEEGTFAGALGFEFDLETRELRRVCAGISHTWIASKARQGVLECPGKCIGKCLGVQQEERFEACTIPVEVDESFYFMTAGLGELVAEQFDLPLERYPAMVEQLRALSHLEKRRDDATAVCIHICSLPRSLVRQDGWPRIIRFNGYGDYQRFKGEVGKILAEVTGKPHSLQEVAVHEALANAMECRDGVPRQHKARLRFNKVGNRLIVRVKTSRIGFAGNAVLRRLRSQPEDMFSFGEDASMGRGIPMMLSMSDRMTYNSEGTEVLLAWKL